jgi:hypothetical protein
MNAGKATHGFCRNEQNLLRGAVRETEKPVVAFLILYKSKDKA